MIEDLTIKCDEITSVRQGGFREQQLSVDAANVDVNAIIDQANTKEILEYIGCVDLVDFLESEGYTITTDG